MSNNQKSGMSPIAAGAIGALVGALGGAAVVSMTDRKTKQKIGKTITGIKDKGMELADGAMKYTQTTQQRIGLGSTKKTSSKGSEEGSGRGRGRKKSSKSK